MFYIILYDPSIHLQSEEEWETYLLGVSVPEEFVGSSKEDDNSLQLTIPTAQSNERQVLTTSVSNFLKIDYKLIC